MEAYSLNRAQRRLLARRGVDVSQLGRAYNRAAPGTVRPDDTPPEYDGRFGALPETAAGWESWLRDKAETPEAFAKTFQSGEFKAALNSYAHARNTERKELLAQMREQTEAQMTEWLKENQDTLGVKIVPDLSPLANGSKPSPVFNNPAARGAPLNGIWPDVWSFLQDIDAVKKNNALTTEGRKRMDLHNAYSERVPSEGGFLVPEEFRSELMQLSLGDAIVRPAATVIPMGSPRMHIPAIDETSRVSSIFGGVVVYRTEEGGEIPESSASFASIKLDVTKQTALSHVPNELIRDWGAFAAFMAATLPKAMGYFEDIDYISGSGVGAPLGALNANNTALLAIAARGGQTTATIVWENALDMYSRMLPSSIGTAKWLASPDAFVQLATMALSVGTGGSAVWLTDGRNAPQLTLLGRPVEMSEKAPGALGAQGDLSFVDWKQYLLGDYQSMTVDSSPHVKFTSDKTSFRAIARNDGRPWMTSPLTPRNNSATLSPYITLAAR